MDLPVIKIDLHPLCPYRYLARRSTLAVRLHVVAGGGESGSEELGADAASPIGGRNCKAGHIT